MSPRRSAAEALRTRDRILRHAVEVASLEGLEGITIGRLASDMSMSKAGVLGHFGTKEQLQLAALDEAMGAFRHAVWEPASGLRPGRERLHGICEAWIAYLEGGLFPGGCFLTAASCEFDGRPGAVREAVSGGLQRWRTVLVAEARRAIADGDLPSDADAEQVAFELSAVAMATNQAIQLHGDPLAPDRARLAIHRILDS